MARASGMTLDRVDTEHRAFAAPRICTLRQAGSRAEPSAISTGAGTASSTVCRSSRCRFTGTWKRAHLDDPDPPLWRVHVQGQPGVRLSVDLEKRAGDTSPTSAEQIAVAGAVINAIPIVLRRTARRDDEAAGDTVPAGASRPLICIERGLFRQFGPLAIPVLRRESIRGREARWAQLLEAPVKLDLVA